MFRTDGKPSSYSSNFYVVFIHFLITFRPGTDEKTDSRTTIIAIILPALSVAIVLIVFVVWKKKGKKTKRRQSLDEKHETGKTF